MMTPETLRHWDRDHLWHPFTALTDWEAAEPLVIDRAEGVYLFDVQGRRYLDGVSSLWCNVHGHRHPTLDAALRDQIDKVAHTTLLGLSHPTAIELARRLAEITPEGLTRVFFSDDGATAVEVALKMAFQYWRQKPEPEPKRTRFVALGGAYHGDTLGDVSVGGVDRFHAMFGPLLFPSLRVPSPHCYRCPLELQQPSCALACLNAVDRVLAEHPGEVAAIVVEPLVQGAAGMIVHPDGYLRGLRELSRAHGTLLIADEVAVGFGRTGTLFACEQEQVSPDILCLAKGLTGGYLPLAATLTTEAIYSAFRGTYAEGKTFYHGHTYGGNPLGAAVALACLRVFEEEQTLVNLVPKVDRLADRLAAFRELPHVGDARQRGLIAGIELVADKPSKTAYPWTEQVGTRVCMRARDFGLLVRPLGDVLVIMPPLTISLEQIDEMLDILIQCVTEITEGLA
ncbi:adenosylmethionine-8-amino-7-oxononanoate aminotransferase apoenzyme [Singulisphaera sp. GP187]|uniref:adenosylmethionine--8-amino-7-oxononanoate transaminase n=1 Tax=Singulisphaera sp. GP187 TaxID=1882752 RepID=UPI00092BB6FA|nr:adenosylmethionine--8-amino-7-oxononanoate transaminase [Singulisphaera sp. GP187]SIO14639.1 adenosylmethionine-8-amino-7-oxononanoate aminotransferase apoenzyme [Singulisphaera sp. GP187]